MDEDEDVDADADADEDAVAGDTVAAMVAAMNAATGKEETGAGMVRP